MYDNHFISLSMNSFYYSCSTFRTCRLIVSGNSIFWLSAFIFFPLFSQSFKADHWAHHCGFPWVPENGNHLQNMVNWKGQLLLPHPLHHNFLLIDVVMLAWPLHCGVVPWPHAPDYWSNQTLITSFVYFCPSKPNVKINDFWISYLQSWRSRRTNVDFA